MTNEGASPESDRGAANAAPPPEQKRLFVAVQLPDAWVAALAEQQRALRARLESAAGALRWVPPRNAHLTLVFLGERPLTALGAIEAAVRDAAAPAAPFTLRLAGSGTFGGRRPRVLFARVEGELTALSLLQRRLARALGEPEIERFSPHITLARVPRPDRAIAAALQTAIEAFPQGAAPAHRVEGISLIESELRPGGAVYTERFVVRFRSARLSP